MNAVAEPDTPVVRCAVCTHVLHDPESRRRGIGPVCLTRLPGGWLLAWHHRPPRLGHLPHGDVVVDGQAALFPAQSMIPVPPGQPVEGEATPTSEITEEGVSD